MPFGPVLGEPDLRRQRRMPQHERPTRLWMSRRTQGRSVHVLRKRWERPFALVRISATDRAFLASKQIEEREAQNSKEENPKNLSSFTSVQLQMGYQELYMNLCMDLEFLTDKKYHSKIVMCTRNSSLHPLKHKSESENNRSYWMKHRFTTLLPYSWYIPFYICFAFYKTQFESFKATASPTRSARRTRRARTTVASTPAASRAVQEPSVPSRTTSQFADVLEVSLEIRSL